jgi:HD-GYP domain-containing protein (c-di-GMP phosphodiesterase class II)
MADLHLAEVLAPLSGVTDLGMGQPPETAIRACLLATGLARRLGIPEREVSDIYYTTLLQHIGCTAYAHETAALVGGDDVGFRAAGAQVDDANPREMLTFLLTGVASDAAPPTRARAMFNMVRAGSSFGERLYRSNCEVAVRTAERLGLSPTVQQALDTIYARWDGKGVPAITGDAISLAARFAQVVGQGLLFHHLGGPELAIAKIRQRGGTALDPTVADAFVEHGREVLAEIDTIDPALAVIDGEPEPRHRITESRIDDVARAFGDMADLKSPWLHGHSTGVATLADGAARTLDLPGEEVIRIRQAGYLHDLGRVGVPSGIWGKSGPLTTAEWEQVRLHPYHAERILAQSPALASLAPLAGMHHERLDGSGYHHGIVAAAIPIGARVLAVANAYQARIHERPHRPARPPEAVAALMQAHAEAGRMDADAVGAVLEVAGHEVAPKHRTWPAGLTDREVQVLRLAAHGMSNREIGASLSISPKTAGHHIQHIYDKVTVSTRAGAALFAMEHGLLQEPLLQK